MTTPPEEPEVTVDPAVCEAHGCCEEIAPEIFQLDDDDVLHIRRPHPRPDELDLVRRAVRNCPKAALTLNPGRR